ncbi:Interferon-induced transmembrane protein [Aequorivita sublithincola DSM 14238]|uniref:Interferon-induced transmembrane protein n=1 Tax=Aequorivita sublithincola (strain DSM 14238 / LMG 21431 / ACAM 643 / 9-3) TaxID=746697 RepID=I3YVF6_AEQSU|nr:CD225/dispanin family protein [Aequorivita sublithincola]AFL80974.1 Interferon-induced transmembrane protein [Aequorivita sublithincola DSM 14238]
MMETTNQPMGAPPDNNLVWAILCTVLCCLPLGIVSIIKSTKVKELWAQGDAIGAQKAADDAKKYAMWGAGVGVIFLVLYIILVFVIGIGGAFAGNY